MCCEVSFRNLWWLSILNNVLLLLLVLCYWLLMMIRIISFMRYCLTSSVHQCIHPCWVVGSSGAGWGRGRGEVCWTCDGGGCAGWCGPVSRPVMLQCPSSRRPLDNPASPCCTTSLHTHWHSYHWSGDWAVMEGVNIVNRLESEAVNDEPTQKWFDFLPTTMCC